MVVGDEAAGSATSIDPLVGTIVGGRFQIIDLIARGGMSSVYFATQVPLNRPVAVKVLRGASSSDAETPDGFRRRFLQEASILSQLSHPNIVTLLEYGQITQARDKPYFMAMEYLRGETLAQRFRARGRLSVEESIRLTRQIGRGLREAHRRGFVHRDLKPSNIMLVPEDDRNDIVKLVDFGIGKIVSGRLAHDVEDETRVGLLLGSPRHMAPEQIRCEPVEVRTDLYGLGVILFQALTGQLPFDGRTEVDVLMAHCSLPPPGLHEMCPNQLFPDALSRLVRDLLHKHPSGRPTIDEFLERLACIEAEIFGRIGLAGPTLYGITPPPRIAVGPDAPSERNTLVTQADWVELPGGLFSGAPSGSVPPHSLAVSQRKRRGRWAVAFGLLAATALVAGTWINLQPHAVAPTPRVIPPKPSAPVLPPENAVKRPETTTFSFDISSTPAAATVREGGVALGVTPLKLTIPRDSVASAPRQFIIEREGYQPYVIEQGDSETDVSVSAVLLANARKTLRSRVSRSTTPPSSTFSVAGEGALAAKRNAGIDLDIRPRR
ncbi:MAG: serine/threonine-protein kinase [Myxococcota bacterium]